MAHIHELYDFTVSAFVLHPTEPKICLHYHKKLNSWLQPGGHIELNEDPIEALRHELLEEAGLSPSNYEIIETSDQPRPRGSKTIPLPAHFNVHEFGETGHKHIDLGYLVKSNTVELRPQMGESVQIGWFSIEEIRKLHEARELLDGTLDICEWILNERLNLAVKNTP